jgi:3'-phosphoadenosine 5'-phosphosulfate sulfotransferase (PAPS reductase)/FAD synthetase
MKLIELQTLVKRRQWPLERKVAEAKKRIIEWYEAFNGMVYIAFSGGLDSTVLVHLVRSILPDVPAVFPNTGLEYPENVHFVKTIDNVEIIRPTMPFRQVVESRMKTNSLNCGPCKRGGRNHGLASNPYCGQTAFGSPGPCGPRDRR